MNKGGIEREYRFEISADQIKREPPEKINGFELVKDKHQHIEDIILERRGSPFGDEDAGLRVRRAGEKKHELTYKKFLRKSDAVEYEEKNVPLTKAEYDDLQELKFDEVKKPLLETIRRKGELYQYLTIRNSRRVYVYKKDEKWAKVYVEDISYLKEKKVAFDYLLEIEVGSKDTDYLELVMAIKDYYQAKEIDEGKMTRGIRKLGFAD